MEIRALRSRAVLPGEEIIFFALIELEKSKQGLILRPDILLSGGSSAHEAALLTVIKSSSESCFV